MFLIIAAAVAIAFAVIEQCFFIEKSEGRVKPFLRDFFAIFFTSLCVQKYVMKFEHIIDTSKNSMKDYLLFLPAALAVGAVFLAIVVFIKRAPIFEKYDEKPKKRVTFAKVMITIFFALGALAYFGSVWGGVQFGEVTGDQLLINLTSPTEGTELSVYTDGFEFALLPTAALVTLFASALFSRYRLVARTKQKTATIFGDLPKRIICFVLALGVLVYGLNFCVDKFKLEKLYNSYILKSDMIDSNYVDPKNTKVTFPEKKRNLIHIYLESIEYSYMSKAEGGCLDTNIIPNLTKLGKEGIVFSNNDNYFGGPMKGTGTQWSAASMINQSTGLPMKAPGMRNAYGVEGNFLPGAYALGDMLKDQGYEQTMMMGSSATFGGMRYFYSSHGDNKIMDYNYALDNGLIPKDYRVRWGYEDRKLYEYAKDELTRLGGLDKPFCFTLQTVDTHRPDGYTPPGGETPFENKYANAIWNSDKALGEFINWVKQQPFYENTTIVMIGDHLTMDNAFCEYYHLNGAKNRHQYNVILNPDPSVANPDKSVLRNREWCNWDMYPTIVAAIGGKIDGDRLAVGTNLFSGKLTMFEQYGRKKVNTEFEKGSRLYNEEILQSSSITKNARARGQKSDKFNP